MNADTGQSGMVEKAITILGIEQSPISQLEIVGFWYILYSMKTTREVAQILGYANDAVIRLMIKQKRIKAKKIGHFWIISDKEVEKLKITRG